MKKVLGLLHPILKKIQVAITDDKNNNNNTVKFFDGLEGKPCKENNCNGIVIKDKCQKCGK